MIMNLPKTEHSTPKRIEGWDMGDPVQGLATFVEETQGWTVIIHKIHSHNMKQLGCWILFNHDFMHYSNTLQHLQQTMTGSQRFSMTLRSSLAWITSSNMHQKDHKLHLFASKRPAFLAHSSTMESSSIILEDIWQLVDKFSSLSLRQLTMGSLAHFRHCRQLALLPGRFFQ